MLIELLEAESDSVRKALATEASVLTATLNSLVLATELDNIIIEFIGSSSFIIFSLLLVTKFC